MTRQNTKESGFTAIELLITLFVAAAFLVSGYQLYGAVIKDSGQARAKARAANIAYDYLKRYSVQVGGYCIPNNALSNSPVSISGLSSVTVSIDITCPKANASGISKVNVTIKYNNPQQTVTYSTYARTGGGTLEDGLVGWWPLNGNASDATVNGNSGTVNGATPTVGQNGQSNNAYLFNGNSQFITLPAVHSVSTGSVSLWFKSDPSQPATGNWFIFSDPLWTDNSRVYIRTNASGTSLITALGNGTTVGSITISNNSWYNLVLSWSGTTAHTYVNGQDITSTDTFNGLTSTGSNAYLGCISGAGTECIHGSIDDVRIYNRALSVNEISALYGLGAF